MRSSKAAKGAKQPDKEAQQEQKLILKDVKDNMFRAAVVPAAYSVDEFLLGACTFQEVRMKGIKLTEDEVSSSTQSVALVCQVHLHCGPGSECIAPFHAADRRN